MTLVQALSLVLALAEVALLARLLWLNYAPWFAAYLWIIAILYSVAHAFGGSWISGWRVWLFFAMALLVAGEAARLNWGRKTSDTLLVLAGVAMLAFTLSPDGTLALLAGTEPLRSAYRVQGVANALGLVLALVPACVAMMERPVREWDWRIEHGLLLAAWFAVTLVALAAWRDAPVPTVLVDGVWRENPEYWVRMRWVFGGEAAGHLACCVGWWRTMR